MDIFLQKCIDSLQEAFIHPQPYDARFKMDLRALFWLFGCWTKTPSYAL